MKKVLKGWIADNPVTADKTDRILLLESQGSATLSDILDEMKKEDTGLRQETLEHVVNLFLRITTDLVLSGYKVNVGMFYAVAKFLGVLEGGKWNPEKNSIYVSFTQGRDLHKAIAETSVEILGEKANVMYIIETEDRKTGRKDGSATAGRNLFVRGAMLKIAGDDPSVGVTLTDADGTETKLEDDLITTNKPSELTLLLPPELEAGEYTLTVTTQFTSGVLLKTPRSVSTSIWIGGRPEEGGATVKLEVQHLHRPPPPFPLRSKDGGGRWRCCTSNLTVAKLIQRKDMSPDAEEGAKKYYGSVSATGTLGFDQICSNIAAYSTASPGDVKLVLDGLVFVASEALLRGEVVQLGELGNFQLKVSSTGTETAEEFDASMFGNPRIVFRPSIRLKTAIARVSVEKWPVITTSGSTSTDDEEERPGGL